MSSPRSMALKMLGSGFARANAIWLVASAYGIALLQVVDVVPATVPVALVLLVSPHLDRRPTGSFGRRAGSQVLDARWPGTTL